MVVNSRTMLGTIGKVGENMSKEGRRMIIYLYFLYSMLLILHS